MVCTYWGWWQSWRELIFSWITTYLRSPCLGFIRKIKVFSLFQTQKTLHHQWVWTRCGSQKILSGARDKITCVKADRVQVFAIRFLTWFLCLAYVFLDLFAFAGYSWFWPSRAKQPVVFPFSKLNMRQRLILGPEPLSPHVSAAERDSSASPPTETAVSPSHNGLSHLYSSATGG